MIHKHFKLMLALIVGLFTIPLMGSTVFAQSADDIADGEYDLGVTALEKGTSKESVADDFVHDPILTIKDGNPSLTLKIGADGGAYENFDFNINWFKVNDKEPISEDEEGEYTYYTFSLDEVKTAIPASMEYVVPGFPSLADGHEVAFDLQLDGLEDLPEKPEKGEITVSYVDQHGENIADSETLEGDIGASYETERKDVDGYDFVEVNGNESGEFSEETATVEYVYEKHVEEIEQGEVTVSYVDQNGENIAKSETLEGDVGASYEAEQKKLTATISLR